MDTDQTGTKSELNLSALSLTETKERSRWKTKIVLFAKALCESMWFRRGIGMILCIDALMSALESDKKLKNSCDICFDVANLIFISIYVVEFIVKVIAKQKKYFTNGFDLFDFSVMIIGLVHVILNQVNASHEVEVLGHLGSLRILRTVSTLKGLQVLLVALLDTFKKWIINIFILLLIIMFLFAMIGYHLFGMHEDGDFEHWSSLGKAFLTLFTYVTVDGWTDLQSVLEEKGFVGSVFFSVGFLIIGHFIFENIFVAVVIMNISETTDEFRRQRLKAQQDIINARKNALIDKQYNDVKKMLVMQKKENFATFEEMVKKYKGTLKHDEHMVCSDRSTKVLWMETFIQTLDHMDNTMYCVQQLQFEMANHLTKIVEKRLQAKKKAKEIVTAMMPQQ